jgi:hypothetical protein
VILRHRTTPDRKRVYTLNSLDEPIRRSILYADKVRLATTDYLPLEPSPTMKELEAAGLLSYGSRLLELWTTPGEDPFPDQESFVSFLQYGEFTNSEREEPGVWTMDQEESRPFLPDGAPSRGRSIYVSLEKLLPVPAPDVPIATILAFKQKRAAELLAFQSAMDGLYLMITSSNDAARPYEIARDAIQRAVADMVKAMKQSMSTKVITSCKIALNLSDALTAAQIGTISGVMGSAIKLATMVKEVPTDLKRLGPFAYVHQVIDELV